MPGHIEGVCFYSRTGLEGYLFYHVRTLKSGAFVTTAEDSETLLTIFEGKFISLLERPRRGHIRDL